MSQIPPMSAPPPAYLPPARPQSNVAAVVSLITGILGCIPGVSLLAVILGIVGIVKAGRPNVGGKGLAIAGLILGLIGCLGWTGGGLFIAVTAKKLVAEGAPARAVAKQFATDVGKGDADAAIRDCSSSMSPDKVRAAVSEAQSWGAFRDATFLAFNLNTNNGSKTMTIGGSAVFANATKPFSATLNQEDGVYRIIDFSFGPPQTNAPTQP